MNEYQGLSKNKLKYLNALRNKKQRQKYNKFIVEGDKIGLEFLQQDRFQAELIFAVDSWIKMNKPFLKLHLNKTITVSEAELKKISGLTTPNQVLIVVDGYQWEVTPHQVGQGLSLYLDGIRDPGNMGTIIRIADWFGVDQVFCSPDCVEVHMPKVVQSAMGAIFRVPVLTSSLAELKSNYPAWPLYGTVLDGDNIYQAKLPQNALLVIGNESKGISEDVRKLLDHRIAIPASAKGGTESLNAAVATGICCALFRQKSFQ